MSSTQTEELVVRKSVTVNCSPEVAFELFTERKTEWWPYESHAASGEKPEQVVYEPRVGGRVYDRLRDGRENQWATVLAWEPPYRVVIEWNVNPANPTTELEVRFTPEGDGTRVDLEHRGWENLGELGAQVRQGYDSAWHGVLAGYGETASYGEIARRLGKSNAASRAVGLANGSNPIPIVIPCHRVIGADGTLTGYAGGVGRKQVLLEIEQDALF